MQAGFRQLPPPAQCPEHGLFHLPPGHMTALRFCTAAAAPSVASSASVSTAIALASILYTLDYPLSDSTLPALWVLHGDREAHVGRQGNLLVHLHVQIARARGRTHAHESSRRAASEHFVRVDGSWQQRGRSGPMDRCAQDGVPSLGFAPSCSLRAPCPSCEAPERESVHKRQRAR
jgi:hypothetical protein